MAQSARIRITPAEARRISTEFQKESDASEQLLGRLEKHTAVLRQQWEGQAKESFLQQYGAFKPEMKKLAEKLAEISRDLKVTAQKIEEADKQAATGHRQTGGPGVIGAGAIAIGSPFISGPGMGNAPSVGGSSSGEESGDHEGAPDWLGSPSIGFPGYSQEQGKPGEIQGGASFGGSWAGDLDRDDKPHEGDTEILGVDLKGEASDSYFGGQGSYNFGPTKDGFSAGVAGEVWAVNEQASGVAGNEDLGVTGGIGNKLLSGGGSFGVSNEGVDASLGVNLASVNADAGFNVAGNNVGVNAEVGLKAELGIKIKDGDVKIKLPLISGGFSWGGAK